MLGSKLNYVSKNGHWPYCTQRDKKSTIAKHWYIEDYWSEEKTTIFDLESFISWSIYHMICATFNLITRCVYEYMFISHDSNYIWLNLIL